MALDLSPPANRWRVLLGRAWEWGLFKWGGAIDESPPWLGHCRGTPGHRHQIPDLSNQDPFYG